MVDHTAIYEMSPFDNVLYLPNNVDIRLCPKNGMSTIKEIFRIHKGHEQYVGRSYRYSKVKEFGDQLDLPFRKGSYRIAVRRDPLDRFKSACEYIMRERAEHIRLGRFDAFHFGFVPGAQQSFVGQFLVLQLRSFLLAFDDNI
mgnify:CR=1 FL=1